MNKYILTVTIVVAVVLSIYFINGGHIKKEIVTSGITKYYEGATYTKLVHTTQDKFGKTTY